MEKHDIMKICLVSHEYPPDTARGGIGSQNWNKAKALRDLGHTVHVVSAAAKPGPMMQTVIDDGVIVHRIQPPGFEIPVYNSATYWVIYTCSVFQQIQKLIQEMKYDIIDFAEYGAEGFAYQLDRTPWNWVPTVVQLHGPLSMFAERIGWPEVESEFHQVGTFMEGFSIRNADALMACSANIADFTAGYYAIPRESIDVVHCGVDSKTFTCDNKDRKDQRLTILFVGNIANNKGIKTLYEAVMLIRSKYPDVRLQILGKGDEDMIQSFKSHAKEHGAESNFEFLGFINDRNQMPLYYHRADIFCSPAQHEVGVANVYIEAMASGCPVVASTTGGAPEAVIDGKTGYLVPPNDVRATASALEKLLGDASLRRSMGREARLRVEDYFAMDRYINRVLATYQKALISSRKKLDHLRTD